METILENRVDKLVIGAQNGDIAAFTKLVNHYNRQVFAFVFRTIGSREDAEDITQEVFLKVYKSIKQFRGDATFSTWLYTIARNTCYSHIRKKQPDMTTIDEDTELPDMLHYSNISPESIDTKGDFQFLVEGSLRKLPPKYNMVIQLFYFQQFRYEEIATILQIPLATVKTHLHRALNLLRNDVMIIAEEKSERGVRK